VEKVIIRKIICAINIIAVLAVTLLGFFPSVVSYAAEEEEISGEITVYFNLQDSVIMPYIEAFEQKYTNVKVNYKCLSDYENTMKTMMESGDYGDVLFVPGFLQSEDITTYFAPLGNYYRLSEKYNSLSNSYVSANIVYTIPSTAYVMGIAYNKDVFYNAGISDMPTSIDEFLEDMALIKERTDATPIYINADTDWVLGNWIDFPYLEMTGDPDYKGNEFVYEENPFTEGGTYYEVYRLLYELVARGYTEDEDSGVDWNKTCKDLNNGKCGAAVVGSWALTQIKQAGKNADSISFMPFPNEINGKQYMTLNTDYCYGVSRNSTNRKAAEAFIDFMLDESGYATDRDCISIVKTDPYPEIYGNMSNVVLLSNNQYLGTAYSLYQQMTSQGIDPTSPDEIRDIVSAARNGEPYEKIMSTWNARWEAARPEGTATKERNLDRSDKADEVQTETEAVGTTQAVDSVDIESVYMQSYAVEFSDTEKEYIETKKNIKVGYIDNKAPVQYQSEEDDFAGLSAELCEIIAESTGLEFSYVPYDNEEELVKAVNYGEVDMAAGIRNIVQYDGIVRFSRSYVELTNVIIKNESTDINSLEGGVQAVVVGEVNNISTVNNDTTKEFKTLAEVVKSIDSRDTDFAISDSYSAEYYITEGDYSHVSIIPLTEKTQLCFAYPLEADTRIISITNKCIYSISEEQIQMILMQNMDTPDKQITLRRFIETNPIQSLVVFGAILLIISAAITIAIVERDKSRRKHEIDTKRYAILSQLTDEYVFEYDLEAGVIHFEKKFEDKFSFEPIIRLSEYEYDNENLNRLIENCKLARENEETNTDGFELIDSSGKKQWYRMIAYRISEDGVPKHVIGKIMNIQKTMEENKRMEDMADRDALTGIYNRNGFEKNFNILANRYPKNTPVVFAVLDIDSFKAVNDSLGHVGGDKALKLLAGIISNTDSPDIVAARYGGDEFMICMFATDTDTASRLFGDIVRNMDTDINFQGNTHHLSISLGAVYSECQLSFPVLFAEADTVLYSVKSKGKNGYRLIKHLEEI
jgi:diguanylate cyclase (GGDEF)-like protein